MDVGEVQVFEDRDGLVQLLSHLSRLKHGVAEPDEGEESCYGVRIKAGWTQI